MKKHLLLMALSISALFPVSVQAQSEEPVLTGRAAIERIIGNTTILAPTTQPPSSGKSFIYFSPDERATVQNEIAGAAHSETGHWSIDDQERLCMKEEGTALKEIDCIGITIMGNTLHSVPANIFFGMTAKLAEGNLRGL